MTFPAPTPSLTTAIQTSHRAAFRLDAYRGGALVASALPFIDGEVQSTRATGLRRTYSLNVPNTAQWRGLLAQPGLELQPYRGLNYGSGALEMYPLGRFIIQANQDDTSVGNAIPLSGNDYWTLIAGDIFPSPRSSPAGLVRTVIAQLINETLTGFGLPAAIVTATSTTTMTPVVWDSDRNAAIGDLCTSIAAEAYIDATGQPWVVDRVPLDPNGGYIIVDGDGGTRVEAVKVTDWSGIFNQISVTSTTTDPALVFAPFTVAVTDPTNSAYWRNIGRKTMQYANAQIVTQAQAKTAALALLTQKSAPARTYTITCVPNVTLDEADSITIPWYDGTTENAQIQTITYPMTVDGQQKITTVSGASTGAS